MLTVFNLEQQEEWDSIVRSFKKHDVYWLSGYVKAFKVHGDGEPLLFYYDDGSTRGINVVMRRDIALDNHFIDKIEEKTYYDLSTPYGYGGWIMEGDEHGRALVAYENWINNNNIVCEFVRFHPMLQNQQFCLGFYDVIQLGEVVHIDLFSPDTIWSNFAGSNRRKIKKALSYGVKIYNGRFPIIFSQFRELYNSTMDKNEADDYYYFDESFYKSILDDLPYNSQMFWAQKDDKVIAASIILLENGYMNYHLSGSYSEFNFVAPTNLLLYEVALWGNANRYKTLYLGGGVGSGEDSLFKFKRSFYKGDLNRFFIGKKIYNQDMYDELLSKREDIINDNYFPQYRG